MRAKLQQIGQNLRGSLWFTPSLLVLLGMGLAFLMIALDRVIGVQAAIALPLVFDAGPDGARAVLSTIAGSMLTVAGVAFSITVLVFSFASAQYSSRTLRNFMEDRTNKLVLGTLLATFVYCLLVLRTIHGTGPDYVSSLFVPVLAVSVALLLALLDLGLFTFLIHNIAESFQASRVIKRVADETSKTIDRLFPQELGDAADDGSVERLPSRSNDGLPIAGEQTGYVQNIAVDRLLAVASKYDLLVRLETQIGGYVVAGQTIARVGPEAHVTKAVRSEIRAVFAYGADRTVAQDAQFGFVQLTDIAAKALSPGINDPTTAVMCLDQIGRLLRQLATRSFPARMRCDAQGTLRIVAERPNFAAMVAQCFDPLRRYGMADAALPIKMIDVLGGVAGEIDDIARLQVLAEHARAIIEACDQNIRAARDQRLIKDAIRRLPPRLQRQLPDHV